MSESLTVQDQLIVRASKDEAFRQQVIADPRGVLASEYNVNIPENVTIRVIEDTPNTVSIVLPAQEEVVRDLSDEDLEAVAGGFSIEISWTLFCIHTN